MRFDVDLYNQVFPPETPKPVAVSQDVKVVEVDTQEDEVTIDSNINIEETTQETIENGLQSVVNNDI